MALLSERVEAIFRDCLFSAGENTSRYVRADGVTLDVGFHPARLHSHAPKILEMLLELPDAFRMSVGKGWSFLQACEDRHGRQWTDLHQRMEQLFQLGIGIGKVKSLMPRESWHLLPGGMPYYVILDVPESTEPVNALDLGILKGILKDVEHDGSVRPTENQTPS